jgi:zinc transporter
MTTVRFELPDTRGLIGGFVFRPNAAPAPIGWAEMAHLSEIRRGGFVWLHFNLTDVRARDWIVQSGAMPPRAAAFLLAAGSRISLDRLGPDIVGVLGDLHHDFELDPESMGLFHFYAGADLVVSGRRHPLRAVDRLRREILGGAGVASPIALLTHLLDHLAGAFEDLIEELADQVDGIEDRILSGRFEGQSGDLGQARRLMSRLRRHLNAERHELAAMMTQLPDWCSESDATELRRAIGRLDSFGQDLDLLYERGRLLQEEISNRRGEATNRNLYVLSIVTAVFLPMTLVTGLFGINVGGMPWLQDQGGFWIVLLVTLGTAVATFLLLYWRRLF